MVLFFHFSAFRKSIDPGFIGQLHHMFHDSCSSILPFYSFRERSTSLIPTLRKMAWNTGLQMGTTDREAEEGMTRGEMVTEGREEVLRGEAGVGAVTPGEGLGQGQ